MVMILQLYDMSNAQSELKEGSSKNEKFIDSFEVDPNTFSIEMRCETPDDQASNNAQGGTISKGDVTFFVYGHTGRYLRDVLENTVKKYRLKLSVLNPENEAYEAYDIQNAVMTGYDMSRSDGMTRGSTITCEYEKLSMGGKAIKDGKIAGNAAEMTHDFIKGKA